MSADDQREQRAVSVLDADAAVRLSQGAYDLSVTTGLSYEQAHQSALEAAGLIAASHERDELRAKVGRADKLLRYALHLRMYGERAPGGNETWRQFDTDVEHYLRGDQP